jgi:hypothetical protein
MMHRLATAALFLLMAGMLFLVPFQGCKDDATTDPGNTITPITSDLFPLVPGRVFIYSGNAITTSGVNLPDPTSVYRTVWVVGTAGPFAGSTVLVDSTTLQHPVAGVITSVRTLLVRKDTTTKDFDFLQTLGPFFRAFKITPLGRTDTLRWVAVAKPSVGVNGTWTALDSTYTDSLGSAVRLQILGAIEGMEDLTDSSASHTVWHTYRSRTYRRISVNGAVIVDNATTSRLWLAADVGPVQIHIAQDTENLGHFRTLRQKNF